LALKDFPKFQPEENKVNVSFDSWYFVHLSMAKIAHLPKNEVNKSYEPDDKIVQSSRIVLTESLN
jgi:hypothetical protein